MIHIVKGFRVVNEAEVDVFIEIPCFLHDPTNVGNLIFGSSAFSKLSLYIWKFSIHLLLKRNLKDFEYNLANMWNVWNCTVVWTFFGIALHWDWNENKVDNSMLKWNEKLFLKRREKKKNAYFFQL